MTVTTSTGLKLTLKLNHIKNQVKVIDGSMTWYELLLTNGAVVKLKAPLDDVPHQEVVRTPQIKDLPASIPSYERTSLLKAEDCSSAMSGSWVGVKQPVDETKYRGEMLWGHKTAPEIIIVDKKKHQIIKDVDMSKLAKRR